MVTFLQECRSIVNLEVHITKQLFGELIDLYSGGDLMSTRVQIRVELIGFRPAAIMNYHMPVKS
jgi:hypothetical protein